MPHKLLYIILPNPVIYERFQDSHTKVFTDRHLKWNEFNHVSSGWGDFDNLNYFNYEQLLKKICKVSKELRDCPCSFYLEKHLFYCCLVHQMKMGETVYVKYVDEKKYVIEQHLKERQAKQQNNTHLNNEIMFEI